MLRILETAWASISVVTLMIAVYKLFVDWQSAVYMFIFAAISIVMYTVRRKQRIRYEQDEREKAKYH